MKIKITTTTLAVSAFVFGASESLASHYVAGVEGIDGSVVPPAGVYYRGYAVNYQADGGDGLPGNSEVDVNALANRFVWITEKTFLGANVGVETIVPIIQTDLQLAGGLVNDDETGIGDSFLGGVLGWHGARWDAVAALGYWFETGDDDSPAAPGLGYGETMLTLGGNLKLSSDGRNQLSLLSRYTTPSDAAYDDEWVVEWSLLHQLDNGLKLGISGYDQWSLDGGDVEKHAAGVEANYFWPSLMVGINVAAYKEYNNKSTFEGDTLRLTLTKVF